MILPWDLGQKETGLPELDRACCLRTMDARLMNGWVTNAMSDTCEHGGL